MFGHTALSVLRANTFEPEVVAVEAHGDSWQTDIALTDTEIGLEAVIPGQPVRQPPPYLAGGVEVDIPLRPAGPIIDCHPNAQGGTTYVVYLNTVISAANPDAFSAYAHIVNILVSSTDADTVVIHINSPGGDVFMMTRVMTAMMRCKAKIVTVAAGSVMSAAGPIWLMGKERIVLDSAIFMFHMSSHSDAGSTVLVKENATFMDDYVDRVIISPMRRQGLITDEEYAQLRARVNIYLDARTVRERISPSRISATL